MACQELGAAAAPAIPSLARLVDDPQIGHLAVAALAEIGPQTFPLLTNAMDSRWPSTRFAAVGYLRRARPPERALPPLLAALRSSESQMRHLAAESLGALGIQSLEVVAVLTGLLDDPDTAVRVSAARSLGWCGNAASGSVDKLLALHRSLDDGPDRKCVAVALVAIDPTMGQRVELPK
jgi:HEAT repeat protein